MLRVSLFVSTVVVLTTMVSPVFASDKFRCNNHIVEHEMNIDEVRKLCGEPTYVEGNNRIWVYDLGENSYLKVLTFFQNKVQFIEERPR